MKFGISEEILILCNKTIIFQYIQNPTVRKNKVLRIHIVLLMSCKPFDVRGGKILAIGKKELVPADFPVLLELNQLFLTLFEFLCGFLGGFPSMKPGQIFLMKFGIFSEEKLILCNKAIIFQ